VEAFEKGEEGKSKGSLVADAMK